MKKTRATFFLSYNCLILSILTIFIFFLIFLRFLFLQLQSKRESAFLWFLLLLFLWFLLFLFLFLFLFILLFWFLFSNFRFVLWFDEIWVTSIEFPRQTSQKSKRKTLLFLVRFNLLFLLLRVFFLISD